MSINWLKRWVVRDAPRHNDDSQGGVFVFLDESGDLGMHKRSSRYFIVAGVVTQDVRGVELIARKVFRGFLKKERKKRKGAMLHARKDTDKTRKRLLSLFAAHNKSTAIALVIDKEKIPLQMQKEKHALYNQYVARLLDMAITNDHITREGVTLIASRREKSKHLNQVFCEHIQKQAAQDHKIAVKVLIKQPAPERSLQVADTIAWAVYQKYENGDGRWCRILGENGIDEMLHP